MSAGREPESNALDAFEQGVELLVDAIDCALRPDLVTELEQLAEGSVSATAERLTALLVLARRLVATSAPQREPYISVQKWKALIHEVLSDGLFRTQSQLCTEINAKIDARTDGPRKHMTPKNLWRVLELLEEQRLVVSTGKGRSKTVSWAEPGGPSKPPTNTVVEPGGKSKPLRSMSAPPSPEPLPSRSLTSASPTSPAAPKKGAIPSP